MIKRQKIFISISYCLLSIGNSYIFAQNWASVNNGVNNVITDFYSDSINNRLYMVGYFAKASGTTATGICYWDGINFNPLGCGFDWNCVDSVSNNAFVSSIQCAIKYNNEIYAGGNFFKADGKPIKNLAKWNGVTWDSIGKCPNRGVVDMLVTSNNELIVVGDFDSIGGIVARGVAKWNGSAWSTYGNGLPNSVASYLVYCVIEYQGELYIGGNYSDEQSQINEIAKWNGAAWVNPGIRFYGGSANINSMIIYNDELYVGGSFYAGDGNTTNSIIKYDGNSWIDVGGGIEGLNTQIYELATYNNDLYAVGRFSHAGGVYAMCFARWDGTDWCGLGTNFTSPNFSICSHNNELYIGCGSKTIEGDTVNYIAKWIGGNYVDTCGNTTGVNENNKNNNSFVVYPNPATNQISIEFTKPVKDIFIEIKNILGETVYSEALQNSSGSYSKTIDISKFSNGVYFVQLQSRGIRLNRKFIKQ